MDIKELESFNLGDAVKFHDQLNPALWTDKGKLDPEVKDQLMTIAKDFMSEIGVSSYKVEDITISGSNAAYSYTPHSDLDLHILVDFTKLPDDEVYRELFNAKKTLYNDTHNIKVHGVPVELYVQDSNQPHHSLGEYSLLKNEWIKFPKKRRANFDQASTRLKYEKLGELIELALKTKSPKRIEKVLDIIKRYRKAGLEKTGEFGPENLAFKALRKQGMIQKLWDLKQDLHSRELSIEETKNKINFDPVVKDILDILPDAKEIWFHGSRAIGKHKRNSDIDVLVIVPNKTTPDEYLDINRNLYKLSNKHNNFDIQPSHENNIIHRIAKEEGKLLYSAVDEDYDPNGPPPGPEFPPTMPKGTIRVDVSDVYDWYKLGQHISNMKGLGKHDFGKGPPSTILSFGDEDLEHKYIDALKKTGLDTTDIDPIDPKQPKGMKRQKVDPTYNVGVAESSDNLNYIGNCTDDDVIEHIFGDATNFAQAVEEHGDEFTIGDLVVKYDPESDVHSFYYKKGQKVDPTYNVNETFDQPYSLKWEKGDHGDIDAYAQLDDGNYLSIMFNKGYDTIDGYMNKAKSKEVWSVEFYRNNSQEVTGEGDAMRVFATVLSAIQTFVKKYKPNVVMFSASKDNWQKQQKNSESRSKLYTKLVNRYANNWGYSSTSSDNGDKVEYTLSKIQKPVAEASGYIPSKKEKNDPRFKTALTIDVKPDSIVKNAKAFGFKTSRAGIPPQAKINGKI